MKVKKLISWWLICYLFCYLFCIIFIATANAGLNTQNTKIVEVDIKGVINEGTVLSVKDAFKFAKQEKAKAIIVVIDTPGGILESTKEIVSTILNSNIPVITYVYPKGAFAASAGSLILISGNLAAMCNGTAVGSATPLTEMGTRANNKTVNYIAAYAESIANLRHRPAEIVKSFVTEGRAITAEEAYKDGLINVLADSKQSLIKKINGMTLNVNGRKVKLNLDGAKIVKSQKSLSVKFYGFISSPVVVTILFITGLYGILFGITSPGIFPETIGVLCLILALFGFGLISINVLGVLLILVGALLLLAELHVYTHGILGFLSIVCVTVGALILVQEPLLPKNYYTSIKWMVGGFVIGIGSLLSFVLFKAAETRKMKEKVGGEAIVGEEGVVIKLDKNISSSNEGFVKVRGEIWKFLSDDALKVGDKVKVIGREGLTLKVKKR